MNQNVFARNVAALMAQCPDLTPEIIQASLQGPCDASLVNHPGQFPNIRFEHNGQAVHLYEGTDPQQNIQALVGKQLQGGPVSHILTIGFGLGLLHHELLARKSAGAKVFIVEPNLRLLLLVCSCVDVSDILKHPDVVVLLQADATAASRKIGGLITIADGDFKGWRFVVSTPTLALYKDFASQFVHVFGSVMTNQKMQLTTMDKHGEMTLKNSLLNLKQINGNSYLSSYKDQFKGKRAILIAAGPSLKKQLPMLQQVQENYILIAAGQTIKTLHAHGIHPHFVVAADPQDALQKYFDSDQFTREILLCLTVCSAEVVRRFPGHKVFFQYTPKIDQALSRTVGSMGTVSLGGSVANVSFSLARYFGIDELALVGQDLAYTHGESHTDGYVNKKVFTEDDMAKNIRYRKVPGYYGDEVYTNRQMDTYRNWFEQVLERDKQVQLYNCTEGGAKIMGTVQMPFVDFLKQQAQNQHISIPTYPVQVDLQMLSQLFRKDLQAILKINTLASDGCQACLTGIKNTNSTRAIARARKSLVKLRALLTNAQADFNPYLFFLWSKAMLDMGKIDVDQNTSTADILRPYVAYFKNLINACDKSKNLLQMAITH
jgi:hypothetical protein